MTRLERLRPVSHDESDRIDELLRALPDPPPAWIARAEELPLLDRVAQDLDRRGAGLDVQDASEALRDAGLQPDERRLRTLVLLREARFWRN
jgi:hypothetical protein